jgi:hypothetical protein
MNKYKSKEQKPQCIAYGRKIQEFKLNKFLRTVRIGRAIEQIEYPGPKVSLGELRAIFQL